MEKKIGNLFTEAGNVAKGLIDKSKEKVISIVDQDDDGKITMTDVSVVKDVVGDAMKEGAVAFKDGVDDTRKQMELKLLKPIFKDTLENADFYMPKLIRVVDRDKKYSESDVCQGSIGYVSDKGGLRVVNIFNDSLGDFGLTFYPDSDCEFYYINPTDGDNYIALDEYFAYMKMVRINELQRVAQELGAKHFKVTYKEERTSFTEVKGKAGINTAKLGKSEGSRESSENKYSTVEVAAEMSMAGHAPKKPDLVYLVKDESVQNLIHLRMTGGEEFHNHKISIKLSNSSGIKEKDAMQIDAALKGFKVSGNSTVTNEAKNESRRVLEYEIEF